MDAQQASAQSQEAVDSATKLYNDIKARFPAAETEFQSSWAAGHAVCRSSSITTKNDTCTRTAEFDALHRLGPKIIPFVVFKLARDNAAQDLWAVFLYNALECDQSYRSNLLADEDLRRCSREIIALNYQRTKAAEDHIKAWEDYHLQNPSSNTSTWYLCDEYEILLEMGPSIIAHVMLGYYDSEAKHGAWYELLHEMIHGHRMRAHSVQKGALFDIWCRWFNWGKHSEAFEYIPTEADRRVYGLE
ncbi:hypothetical protein F5Y03DRAFT_308813 [Xylaria venustula]|nr:hypothetical protein F5Y03DRAFT_308813 [Xylaria venustula]